MAYIPQNKRYPTYPGMYEGITSDQFAANEGRGSAGGETKSKAKKVISKTFDLTGQTDLEVNTGDDGVVTSKKIVTPAGVFEAMEALEDYDSLGPFQSQSIAEAPESPDEQQRMAELYQQQRELADVRDLGVRYGDEPTNLSPVYSFDDDRYLLNHEYYGDDKASVFPSAPSSTSVSRSFLGNVNIDKHGSVFPNDGGNLAISDSDRANAQSKIIGELNEGEMLQLSIDNPEVYAEVVAGNIPFEQRVDPHANKDYTAPGFDGSERYVEAKEKEILEKTLTESLLEDETFLSDDMDLTFQSDVKSAVSIIADEDPDAITELNNFANWADTVTDKEAQVEAERYLQSLADEPSVNDRFKKAMGIAFAAMLFGDDFSTAMNTGLGVVGDDYANEAATEAAAAATQAELNKTLAKEKREQMEWDRQKLISFDMDMAKKAFDQNATVSKEDKAALKKINDNNYKWMKETANGYYNRRNEDEKKIIGTNGNFLHQYRTALQFAKSVKPDVVWDLESNENQAIAFNTTFEKWLQDTMNMSEYGGVPDFKTYIQDSFIKTEMADKMLLPLKDTNPTIDDMKSANINPDTINWKLSKESTRAASETIESFSQIMGEAKTLKLLAKDYSMFKKSKEFEAFEQRAHEQGIGAFIHYVNVEASRPDYLIGTAYDSEVNDNKDVALWLDNDSKAKI
jgi:hypothetical protein